MVDKITFIDSRLIPEDLKSVVVKNGKVDVDMLNKVANGDICIFDEDTKNLARNILKVRLDNKYSVFDERDNVILNYYRLENNKKNIDEKGPSDKFLFGFEDKSKDACFFDYKKKDNEQSLNIHKKEVSLEYYDKDNKLVKEESNLSVTYYEYHENGNLKKMSDVWEAGVCVPKTAYIREFDSNGKRTRDVMDYNNDGTEDVVFDVASKTYTRTFLDGRVEQWTADEDYRLF